MATIDELKRKLREAEETLRVARSAAERQRWTEIVQTFRETIKPLRRLNARSRWFYNAQYRKFRDRRRYIPPALL